MNQPQSKAVIFDFNRTLFDPTLYALYHGVQPMLEELRTRKKIFLYSRKSWDRSGLLHTLKIDRYFDEIYFVEKKTTENLAQILEAHDLAPAECVVVGDMLSDELGVGAELGLTTVWFRQGMFDGVESDRPACVPTHIATTIDELRDLLARI